MFSGQLLVRGPLLALYPGRFHPLQRPGYEARPTIRCLSNLQIEQEEVHASLDQAEGMVSFSESPEGYDSLPMAAYLHTQVHAVCYRQSVVSVEMVLSLVATLHGIRGETEAPR